MRVYRYIFVLCLLSFVFSLAKAQDDARLCEQTLTGTARYMGFCGAMTAIGGDPSAVRVNPAGLGLYRRMEVLVTMGGSKGMFILPEVSFVLAAKRNNFMFSYHSLHNYNRDLLGEAKNDASLGALMAGKNIDIGMLYCDEPYSKTNSLRVRESGFNNEFNFDWAMRISHQWYVGAGFHIQSYRFSSSATFNEHFDIVNDNFEHLYNRNESYLRYTGSSCTFSFGAIYRPTGWLRLGLSLQTPSLGILHLRTDGTFTSLTDSVRASSVEHNGRVNDFHQPLRLSLSTAFQIGAYALIALQYDYAHQKYMDDIHTLRAGFEVIPVMGLYINGGYACESAFRKTDRLVPIDPTFERQDTYFFNQRWKQYASVAVGYRGTYVIAQVAYQYSWQRFNLYAHESTAAPFNFANDTHRVVVTIGWHHNY